MIRQEYFNDVKDGKVKLYNKQAFNMVWQNVNKFEESTGKSIDSALTRDEYIEMLASMQIKRYNSFLVVKSIISSYMEYLVSHDVITLAQMKIWDSIFYRDIPVKSEEQILFFKNLFELRDAIDDTVKSAMNYDSEMWDTPTVILYLLWFGFKMEEVVEIKKSDVMENGVSYNGKFVEMPDFVMSVVNRYKSSYGYYQQAKGIILRKYIPSDYLIRSDRADRFDVFAATTSCVRMNRVCRDRYTLRANTVYNSGLFFRAYMKELNGYDFNNFYVLSEVFEKDMTVKGRRLSVLADYKRYKRLFE